MRKMYIICKNHMDLTWRRCCARSFTYDGFIIRPYLELEELQLDWWLDAAEKDGVHYDIEQTITLREYIARNPDSLPRIQRLVSEGKINILGGGESVIDYNLSDGESIIRNHFYSRRYLKETFDYTPRFAACPDTFGLSAQLPQLFRKLGYPAISTFSRVFKEAKPVWRGVSGHLIALETSKFSDLGEGDYVKYYACASCEGEGCGVCDHTGMEVYYRRFALPGKLENLHEKMEQMSKNPGDMVFASGSEEVLEPDHFYTLVTGLAEQYGYEAVFIGSEEYIANHYARLITGVERNSVPPELIDERSEGNPVAAGCYTSRIKIKQENRRVEAALQAAERFAALAAARGFPYPKRGLERLWRKLAFYQFHDALPASHSDAAYDELIDMARDIKTAAMRILRRATETIAGDIAPGADFAVFNPLAWEVKNKKLEAVLRRSKDSDPPVGILQDANGKEIPFTRSERIESLGDDAWRIYFSADIPALGYNSFKYIERSEGADPGAEKEIPIKGALENEYYRIVLGKRGVESIFDKRLGLDVARDGVCSPYLSDDIGSLWGAWSPRLYAERADKPSCVDVMTPSRRHAVKVSAFRRETEQTAVVEILYNRPEVKLEDLRWKMTVTLRDGSDRIEFNVETCWSARDLRLSARFPFTFATQNDKGIYEIPLGQLERDYTQAFDEHLAHSDDHAALRYFCAYNPEQDYSVGIFNTGTPAHRFQDGELYIGLMRSPTQLHCGYIIDKAREDKPNTFNFALSSWKGGASNGYPARIGWEYNACFPYRPLNAEGGTLPAKASMFTSIPDGIMLSGLKRAEDGNGMILHCYEPYGNPLEGAGINGAQECDILTENPLADGDVGNYGPFEIKTLRLAD